MRTVICCLLIVFACCSLCVAESEVSDYLDMSLEELLNVQVSVGSSLRGLRSSDIPGSVYTISKEEIRQTGARHLGEALMILVPGFMWAIDEDDYIFAFRGLVQDNNSSVLLKVNGQEVGYHYNYGLASQMASLDLNHIERVDIIIGPGGADNGSGPLMATINIVTTEFKEPDSYVESGVDIGSDELWNVHATFHHDDGGDLKAHVSVAFFEQKEGVSAKRGDSEWTVPDGTTGGGGVASSGRYLQVLPGHNIFGRFLYKGYDLSFFHTDQYFDPYEKDTDVFQHYKTQGLKLGRPYDVTDRFSIDAQAWFKRIGAWVRNGIRDTTLGWDIQEGEVNWGAAVSGQYDLDPLKTVVGVRYNHYDYGENPFTERNEQRMIPGVTTVYDLQGNPHPVPEDRMTPSAGEFDVDDYDLFAECHYAVSKNHRFLASAVYSHIDARKDDSLAPRLAYFGQSGNTSWKLFYTRAYKSVMDASYEELSPGAFFRHYTSSDLDQQRIDDFEANIVHVWGPLTVELHTFYTANKEVIQGGGSDLALSDADEAGKYWWTFVNAGEVNTYGLEGILKLRVSKELWLGASHSMVRVDDLDISVDTDLFVSSTQEKLLNYPEDVTRLHAVYTPEMIPNFMLRADLLIDYGRLQGDPLFSDATAGASNLESEEWYNLNIGALYDYKGWEFDFHVYNVLDDRPYQPVIFRNQYAATPTPRSWRVGVSRKFEF
ncbi:MAG: TonB-dependent receptor [Thermodesulfobacteriota bacterium]|nr:TonB-dependent receptor [Thermodesulfobacteriota bacterium]